MTWEHIKVKHQYTLDHNELIDATMALNKIDEDEAKKIIEASYCFSHPNLMNQMDQAVRLIHKTIKSNEKIVIYGDYDCDGIMATSILYLAFKKLNTTVGYYIPNRFIDGYGLTKEKVTMFHERGYKLIITVDNGISANEAIAFAVEKGMKVIVTDHHQVGEILPNTPYLLHPQCSDAITFKGYSGGVVAYKLALALLKKHDPYMLGLASITIISDMVPLRDENRCIVQMGLTLLNKYKFKTIQDLCKLQRDLTLIDYGFKIAPLVNAIGRLPDKMNPNLMVKYLTNQMTEEEASSFIIQLTKLNSYRRKLVEDIYKDITIEENDAVICIFNDTLHEGILGLIANKIVQTVHKPAVVMTLDHSKQAYKGSARSIEGFDLPEVFETLDDLIITSGGHSKAGGLTIDKKDADAFKDAINDVFDMMDMENEAPSQLGVILTKPLTMEQIEAFNALEPFGQTFIKPMVIFEAIKCDEVITLKEDKHLKLLFKYHDLVVEAIYFNQGALATKLKAGDHVSILGDLTVNTYFGKTKPSLLIKDVILL